MTITLAGQEIELRPSGAALVGDALIVADLHLGKERAFRQQGLATPEGATAEALAIVSKELLETNAQRLIFLGDLFHLQNAIAGATMESLKCFLANHLKVNAVLVKGNHDRIPAALSQEIETVPCLNLGELALYHHPQETEEPHLAGHLHPGIRLHTGLHTEQLRCFWLRGQRLILPALGSFTGCHYICPQPGDGVFIKVGNEVRRVPVPAERP